MSITVQVTKDVEKKLRENAARQGKELDRYVSEILEQVSNYEQPTNSSVSAQEADLLQRINLAISSETWAEYRRLVARREREEITPEELDLLISITDQIEIANAERIRHLAELAQLRGISLSALMHELGIQPESHA
jgi:hypothetical protein